MPDARRPRPHARAAMATTNPVARRRTILIAVLAVLAALLVPAVFTATQAHAASNDPVGSLDSVTVGGSGAIYIAGWAADPNAPTSSILVSFSDNGVTKASAVASVSRPDVAAAKPGYGSNHGFYYGLGAADGPHTICVTAANVGSGANVQLGCSTVTLHNNPLGTLGALSVIGNTATVTGTASDPNGAGAVMVQVFRDGTLAASAVTNPSTKAYQLAATVAEGAHSLCFYVLNQGFGANTALGCRSIQIRNNPFGSLDTAGQTPSGVTVTGWAIDLNTTAALTVRAWVDGRTVAVTTAATAHGGLAATYPTEGNNHGYAFNLNLAQGTHRVCVSADNVSYGASAFVGCQNVVVQNNPIGALEHAVQSPGAILVTGYAIDFNTTASIAIHFRVDGVNAGATRASVPRLDVAQRFPTAGQYHGFSAVLHYTQGSHLVCAVAVNIGAGTSTILPCKRVIIQNNPVGAIETAATYPGGIRVGGWAIDPDTAAPVTMHVSVDGRFAVATSANINRLDLASHYPYNGTTHGYLLNVGMTPGVHRVCVYALNLGLGTTVAIRCFNATRSVDPVGVSAGISRVGYTTSIAFSGWAVDPDTLAPVLVQLTVDGVYKGSVSAGAGATGSLAQFPLYGGNHGFTGTIAIDGGEHVVCAVVRNVGSGRDITLGCKRIIASGETVPSIPTHASAWPGSHEVTLSWSPPRSTHPLTRYLLTVNPGHRVVSLNAGLTTVVSHYLTNGVAYSFTLQGVNAYGVGSAVTVAARPTNIPPQITPAPVSTSHYVRNLTGNLASDAAMMRATGASDAAHNPSGHNYLILLQIGGQDEADQGALLSATARFVTYPAVVSAMKAYLDGYATQQRPYAPLTLAIGTNNDVDVSASAGASWARNIVNPVAAYAAAKHPGTMVAGANDMEPGFSASVSATRAWLSGYLSATSARFVFNGSADGCSTGAAGAGCNNGWHMSDLQWLAGGASPTRTISLPQIYNYAMPLQWKYISLTGTNSGRNPINFGGPLTEATACAQAGGSCGSISNTTAWNQLWAAISSSPATRQSQLPNGTDLRIN